MGFKTKPQSAVTATQVLDLLKTIDGLNSGLDSDLLQGKTPSEIISENVYETDPSVSEFTKSLTSPRSLINYINSLVDAKISASLLPQIPWNLITERPTDLSGYGINNALQLTGGTLTGNLSFPFGSISSLPIRFDGDTDTGIYRNDADYIGFVTGGTLGFGITNSKLDIASSRILEVDNTSDVTSFARTSGAFNCAGGGVFMKSFWCDTLNVNSSTIATSTTTGAIKANSLGITGNIYAGNLFGNGSGITDLNASNISSGSLDYLRFNPVVATPPANDEPITVGTICNMSVSSTNGYPLIGHLFSSVATNTRGLQLTNSIDGLTLYMRSRHTTLFPATGWSPWVRIVTENSSNNVNIPATTVSTSPTTGALVVGGGAGLGGTLNIGEDLAVNGKILNNLAINTTRNSFIGLNIDHTMQANGTRNSINSLLTLDNTTPLTTARTSFGISARVDNTLSSTNQSSFTHNIFGGSFHVRNGVNLTDNTGVTNAYGSYNFAENRAASGTIPNLFGAYNRALINGTLGASSIRGCYNQAQVNAISTATEAVGNDNLLQTTITGATMTTAISTRNNITNTNGTITTAYGIYNIFGGVIGTAWGIYSSGDVKNFLTGSLGIGIEPTTHKLDVSGTTKADSYHVGANQVLGARRTGWTAPTGTPSRASFNTETVTLINLARTVKAIIDDIMSHGAFGV